MRLTLLFLLVSFSFSLSAQNVGVGTTTPHSSAALDVQSNNKGMLVPRVALTAANLATPVTQPADALLVYNSATAGSGENSVAPGFYYWSEAAAKWMAVSGAKTTAPTNGNLGFGSWGDCATAANVSEYQPVAAADGVLNDNYGFGNAMDGNWAVVSAGRRNVNGNVAQGVAYVYYFNGTTWEERQKLQQTDGGTENIFGSQASISGNWMAIAAAGHNSEKGAVYLYRLDGSTWVFHQKLEAGSAGCRFGNDVAMSGTNLIVGAPTDAAIGGIFPGAAYIFTLSGGNWVQAGRVTATDPEGGQWFGSSVAISGNRAVVGAPYDDINASIQNVGAAYVVEYNGIMWQTVQKLTSNDGAAEDFFGSSVAMNAGTVAVGAPNDDVGSVSDQGTVHLFQHNGSAFAFQRTFTSTSGTWQPFYGTSLAMTDTHLAVGERSTLSNGGVAYFYQNISGIWRPLQRLTDPGAVGGGNFGASLALSGRRFLIGDFGNRLAFFGKIN